MSRPGTATAPDRVVVQAALTSLVLVQLRIEERHATAWDLARADAQNPQLAAASMMYLAGLAEPPEPGGLDRAIMQLRRHARRGTMPW